MKRVLMDIKDGLTRIALVEDGRLIELYYETEERESLVGNVYMGVVEKVVPNLQACFVNIGEEKNGYYYYGNLRAATDGEKNLLKPKTGESLLLQVEKDAQGTKGPVLSRKISLPGKFMVLLEGEDGEIGVSRKIVDEEERARIRLILQGILPPSFGAVVRTNAQGRQKEAFEKELLLLLQKHRSIAQGEFRKAPALLLEESTPTQRALRDFYHEDIGEVVVNEEAVYQQFMETGDFNGEGKPTLVHYCEKMPLFEAYYVESQSRKALEEKVWLKSGGFLVIQETEACVVIDVNSGKSAGKGDLEKTFLKVNLEAAEEVARQMRLRNLSGIIIVDFIDMDKEESKNILKKALEEAVKKDRLKTVVVGMTVLGLMQITRKKTRPSLSRQMTTKCRSCEGSGRLPSIDWTVVCMRKDVETILANTIYNKITVKGDRRLLRAFCGKEKGYIRELEEKFDGRVDCLETEGFGFGEFELVKEKE